MREQILSALTRLLGLIFLVVAAFLTSFPLGFAAVGLALLALTYLPDGAA